MIKWIAVASGMVSVLWIIFSLFEDPTSPTLTDEDIGIAIAMAFGLIAVLAARIDRK